MTPETVTAIHCCGQPPTITEWRPGCYGAQCMVCGVIVGDERQLSREQLIEEWNAWLDRSETAGGKDRHEG